MTSDYEVLAVRFATRETTASEVYANYDTYGRPDRAMSMDYFFWVIRNENSTMLVDTGFSPDTARARGRSIIRPVPECLDRVGVDAEAVDVVVVTHGHYDHTGYVDHFPNATVLIAAEEMEFLLGPVAKRELVASSIEAKDVETLADLAVRGQLTRISGCHEVAEGVVARTVGGHTPGQIMVEIAAEPPIVLASDALHYYEELTEDRPFSVYTDLVGTYGIFDQLSTRQLRDGAVVVAGHDPQVLTMFPPIDPADPGLGVRIA